MGHMLAHLRRIATVAPEQLPQKCVLCGLDNDDADAYFLQGEVMHSDIVMRLIRPRRITSIFLERVSIVVGTDTIRAELVRFSFLPLPLPGTGSECERDAVEF